jgi:hypothetical protein
MGIFNLAFFGLGINFKSIFILSGVIKLCLFVADIKAYEDLCSKILLPTVGLFIELERFSPIDELKIIQIYFKSSIFLKILFVDLSLLSAVKICFWELERRKLVLILFTLFIAVRFLLCLVNESLGLIVVNVLLFMLLFKVFRDLFEFDGLRNEILFVYKFVGVVLIIGFVEYEVINELSFFSLLKLMGIFNLSKI